MNTSYNTAHGTLINCIDGTVQVSAIQFVKSLWNIEWVDVITDTAPERILSEARDTEKTAHIHRSVDASLCNLCKKRLAIVSHSNCDMNDVPDDGKIEMLHEATDHLRSRYPDAEVVGIWIDDCGVFHEISRAG